MLSKIKLLLIATVFTVFWHQGQSYFFRRWESTASPSSDGQSISPAPNYNEFRMNSFNWVQPLPQVQQNPVAPNDGHVLPIAIPFPHPLIPLAVYPAYGQMQPVSKAHHHLHSVHAQSSASTPTTPTPFVKISQLESQMPPYSLPAVPAVPAPAAVQAVRFVPCLCSGNKDDRWSKTSYQGNAHYVNTAPFQAIQLLPCYCPLVREIESQYAQQPAAVSATDQPSSNGVSTAASKS